MRTAFVGLGWWGRELASAAGRTGGRVAIAGGCSPIEAERVQFASAFGGRSYAALDEVLADASIEAVVLATPHSLHVPQVIACARAGKHVLVEKPLALSTANAKAAVDACRDAEVTLAVGHNRRLLSQVEMMRGIIASGECGTLLHVEANFSTAEALAFPAGHWRTSRDECPGGAMTVLGVHVIDWMHTLFGPVATVTATFASRAVTTGMDDTAAALLTFRSGLTASLVTLYAAPYRNTFTVHGSDATVALVAGAPETQRLRPMLTIRGRDGTSRTIALPYVDTLAVQLERWAHGCGGVGTPAVSGVEAARNIAVLDAIVKSASTNGAPIAVDYLGLL